MVLLPWVSVEAVISSEWKRKKGKSNVWLIRCEWKRKKGKSNVWLISSEWKRKKGRSNVWLVSSEWKRKEKVMFDWSGVNGRGRNGPNRNHVRGVTGRKKNCKILSSVLNDKRKKCTKHWPKPPRSHNKLFRLTATWEFLIWSLKQHTATTSRSVKLTLTTVELFGEFHFLKKSWWRLSSHTSWAMSLCWRQRVRWTCAVTKTSRKEQKKAT